MPPPISPLPLKNGVSASHIWLPAEPWPSLLAFLCHRFNQVSEQEWRQRLTAGEVCDQSGRVYDVHADYPANVCLFYYRVIDDEPVIPFTERIIYESEHLLVVDKPHFLPVTPSGRFLHETVLTRLRHRFSNPSITPLHRLDRETAGLVLFSKQPETRSIYHRLFSERRIHKTYEAIAATRLDLSYPLTHRSRLSEHPEYFFMTHEHDGRANSETTIKLIESAGDLSRYRLEPVTGQKHQLRVHMASLGMPILNDALYPEPLPQGSAEDTSKPLQLLARSLTFVDPVDATEHCFHSDLRLMDLT
jgi:tRNA pseudouridine32 synthase / 23S rRNA pseudouridine746 synthase